MEETIERKYFKLQLRFLVVLRFFRFGVPQRI